MYLFSLDTWSVYNGNKEEKDRAISPTIAEYASLHIDFPPPVGCDRKTVDGDILDLLLYIFNIWLITFSCHSKGLKSNESEKASLIIWWYWDPVTWLIVSLSSETIETLEDVWHIVVKFLQ